MMTRIQQNIVKRNKESHASPASLNKITNEIKRETQREIIKPTSKYHRPDQQRRSWWRAWG